MAVLALPFSLISCEVHFFQRSNKYKHGETTQPTQPPTEEAKSLGAISVSLYVANGGT